MIQNWIGKLLFNICGDLVEDFPNNEIEINKWQGVGEKRNIKFKQNKVREWMMEYFGLNVDVKRAEIELLQFKIPWNRIWKEPTKILVKDAFICVQTREEFSLELMRLQYQSDLKDFIEHCYKKLFNNFTNTKKQSKLKRALKNFFSEMIILEVQNFHLRLEDENNAVKHNRVALGVLFKTLTLQPSYNNKNEQEIKRKLDFSVEALSMYLKIEPSSKQSNSLQPDYVEQQNVIIDPLSFRILIHTNLTQQEEIPLKYIEIQFGDDIKINIDNQQFQTILKLLKLRDWYCQQGDHLQYRPQYKSSPKDSPLEWLIYWKQIVTVIRSRINKQKINLKSKMRNDLVKCIVVDFLHQQYQQNDDNRYCIDDQMILYTDMLQNKQQIEDKLLQEEIELVFYKVNKILNSPEQLKDILVKMNLEQPQQQEKKQTIWSYFWKQKQQPEEGTEFQSKYEKLYTSISQNENRCLKRLEIQISNILIHLKIAQERSTVFMKIELKESLLQYESFLKIRKFILKLKRITAYDCLNPNKDFQTIFCYHSYIERSQRNQYLSQDQSQIEISFEYNKEAHKSLFKVKSLPHLMSLNDTVLARLQPFLKQLRKNDYFYDIVFISQGNFKKSEFINVISNLCKSNRLILDINISHVTIRIPESAIKTNCPVLEITLENYLLQFLNTVTQQINKFAINFQYVEKNCKQSIHILQPVSITTKVVQLQNQDEQNKLNELTDLVLENKISDILITIPILKTDFFKNFIYNVLGTLDNLKKISIFLQKEDSVNQSSSVNSVNRRKRSRSWSQQRDQSSRREDCSSQTSEIYYDAEEFINIPFIQSITQSRQQISPQEKREEMLKKWNKIRINLNYLVNKIFKEADPKISHFLESLRLKAVFELQKFQIKVAIQKNNERNSYFYIDNINVTIEKAFKVKHFGFQLEINTITLSIYKLHQLKQLKKYSGPQSDDIMAHINEDMLNLLPFLLRIKELQIYYLISVKEIKLELQNIKEANQNYLTTCLSNFNLQSQLPFKIMYKEKLSDKPFFLEINNSVSSWDTTCDCKFIMNILYYNGKLKQYEPILDTCEAIITFQKSSEELCFETKFTQLLFNITPQLIFTLYSLNQHSLQIKQFLLQDLNNSQDQIVVKQNLTQKFEIEIEHDNAKLLVDQIEIQHSYHYKTKYRIQLQTANSDDEVSNEKITQHSRHVTFHDQDPSPQTKQQQTPSFKKQTSLLEEEILQDQSNEKDTIKRIASEIDVSEKQRFVTEILGDYLPIEQSTKYIFVNLTVQKLLFNLNGIEQYINEKESKFVRCTEVMAFKFTSQRNFFRYSSLIRTKEERTYFLKTDNRDHKLKTIYYLLSIINRNQNQIIIYQIEQLPKAPYLIKNKCSQLIIFYQQNFEKQQCVLEPGKSSGFCWEDPFQASQLQLEIHYEGQTKRFLIDIDRFNNKELQIDKQLDSTIDKEYSLEIFNDGLQKVIVLAEAQSLKKKKKSYKISCELIGFSFIDEWEILYAEINNTKYFQQQQQTDIVTYQISAENIQLDACGLPIPKRQLYIVNNQINNLNKSFGQKKSITQSQLTQDTQYALQEQLKLKIKQKTISEILVHLKYVKIRIPNYKIIIDSNLLLQVFSFIKHTKLLLDAFDTPKQKSKAILLQQSFEKLNNSNISDKQIQIQPKKIHIDKVIIRPFSVKMRFKNLLNMEQELKTLHHQAGLITFVLNQFQQLNLEFQQYVKTDYQQFMDANYELHIKALFNVFGESINQQIRCQVNPTNFLKNQGNLAKQFITELKNLQNEMDKNDIFQGGLPVKFQLLQTFCAISKSLYDAAQETFVSVLLGIGKYCETSQPDQTIQRTSFSNKLSKLFRRVSDFQFKSQTTLEISFQILISKLKTRRYPKYIHKNRQITSYNEDLSKFQLYRLWKLGLDQQFDNFQLSLNCYLFLSNQLFILLDTQYNQILLEMNQRMFQSITNSNSTCVIKYQKSNLNKQEGDDDIGMKQLKVEKLMLNFTIDEKILSSITNIIKSNVEILNVKENKIFSIMMLI
ncbi:unnamed protein product [Paramecium octaurelia]|uniref:Uncharacterized protein n=1 Tax=Paramecium octaurelia TaxID=43137 RepID=A0A8S1U784_PAROT|nr:unnamed protein product [Paramecium octaurelia]